MVKKQLFFYLRENAIQLDQNTFVRSENLELNISEFTYTVSLADKGMLSQIDNEDDEYSYHAQIGNKSSGNTITIAGTINIASESKTAILNVKLDAVYESSSSQAPSYGYGEVETTSESYDYNTNFTIALESLRDFSKKETYLKARVSELTDQDIMGFSKGKLAYLRNEIFARHGHLFKTDKMSNYFGNQPWYTPYFDDATPFLNETEKKNAQFIRSKES